VGLEGSWEEDWVRESGNFVMVSGYAGLTFACLGQQKRDRGMSMTCCHFPVARSGRV